MELQTGKADGAIRKYEYYSKKIEGILSAAFLLLFFMSFNSSMLSFYTIAFYGLGLIVFVYYFVWFRKKPAYLTIGENSIIVSRGFFFKLEEIENHNIKGVTAADRKIEIRYLKEGVETSAGILNILLDKKDRDEAAQYLQGLTSGQIG